MKITTLSLSIILTGILFINTFTASSQSKSGTVKGFVYDKKTGEPMINTNLFFIGTKYGAQTDNNGYFSVTLPTGSYTMYTTSVGFDTATTVVNILPEIVITKKLFLTEQQLNLKEIEVSARNTEKITHINTGVTRITPKDLKLLPSSGGEPDVAQFLQVVPGVVFTGDQGGQLYIRGGSPAQTGILLDGVTVYNPFHSIGLFSVFETESIRNVDVYSAGFNAEYGNRTSAIVDVHTKDGNKNELGGILSASPLMTRFLLEGPIVKSKNGSGITFLVYGKDFYLDQTSKPLYGFMGNTFKNGLPYNFNDIYGKLTFNAGNGSKLNVFAFNFADDAKFAQNGINGDYKWTATGVGSTFILTPEGSAALIDGKFAYSKYGIDFTAPLTTIPRTTQIDGFEAAVNFTYYLPAFSELKYGVEVSGFHTDLSYYQAANIPADLPNQSTLAGLFVMFRKNFSSAFVMEPSIRFQYYSDINKMRAEPRLGLKYNVSNTVRLKFATGLYSQNIISTKSDLDIVNFFTGFLQSPGRQINNNNGEQISSNIQTAYHVTGGIEVDVNKVELNLEPWLKNFPQLIEINHFHVLPSDPEFIAGTGNAYGLDFSAKYSYKRVYLYSVFSYQVVNYTTIDATGNIQTYPPPFDRRFNMNLVGSYTAGKNNEWDFSARFNLGSPFPFTQTQGFYESLNPLQNGLATNVLPQNGTLSTVLSNTINGGRLSYYHRLDVSAKRKFKLSKKSTLDATFSITNVYDRNNIFYVDRTTNTFIYQLPVFPSINLTWNF
jgi:hypothetical protein